MPYRAWWLLSPSVFCLSGCGIYLHQPAVESATSQIQSNFGALAEPSYFADQRRTLEASAQREDRAVGENALAIRDALVLDLVRPSSLTEPADRIRLLQTALDDLAKIYDGQPTADTLNQLALAPTKIAELKYQEEVHTAVLRDSARLYLQEFEPKIGEVQDRTVPRPTPLSVDCANVPDPPATVPANPLQMAYYSVQFECQQLRGIIDFRNGPHGVGDLYTAAQGELGDLIREVESRRQAKLSAEGRAVEIKAQIERLKNLSEAAQPSDQAELRDEIKALAKRISDAEPIVRAAGLESLAEVLEDATVVALKPDDARAESGTFKARASIALGLIDASLGLADAYSAAPSTERGNAALIGLALGKHKLNMAELDVAREEQQLGYLEAQQSALLEQARHLASTILLLRKYPHDLLEGMADLGTLPQPTSQRAAGEALAAYTASWNDGRIPYQLLKFRALQADRLAALERAAAAEHDYRAAIAPAIDELANYGRGGISETAVVSILGNLGVAGAILGDGE
jgi:hypothetical protein